MTATLYDPPRHKSPTGAEMGYRDFAQDPWLTPDEVIAFPTQLKGFAAFRVAIVQFGTGRVDLQAISTTGDRYKPFVPQVRVYRERPGGAHFDARLPHASHGEWSNLIQMVAPTPTVPYIRPIHADPLPETSDDVWPDIICEFAKGVDGDPPDQATIDAALQIVRASVARTVDPEFLVDFDGALSVDLRLPNGFRLLAELTPDGDLDVGVYDDKDPTKTAIEVEYLPQATAQGLIDRL